jgi:hypothetical protein
MPQLPRKWGSRPLPKFMVGPNAINGRQRRLSAPLHEEPIHIVIRARE